MKNKAVRQLKLYSLKFVRYEAHFLYMAPYIMVFLFLFVTLLINLKQNQTRKRKGKNGIWVERKSGI